MISLYLAAILATSSVSPQQSIEMMEERIKPALQEATNWASDVGLKLIALQAFYAVIVSRLLK